MASVYRWTREANSEASQLFSRAIELDPDFASAYGMAAWCYAWRKWDGFMSDPARETAEAARLARRAAELGKDDAVALCAGGYALAFAVEDLDEGAALINRALALNPNLVTAWHSSGWVAVYRGEFDVAIKHLEHAIRLSPLDRFNFRAQGGIAIAHFLADRYGEATYWAEKAIREQPNYPLALRVAAVSSALAGRPLDAQKAMTHLRQLDPALRVSNFKDQVPLRRPEDLAKFAEGLRKAGLPE